MKLKEIDRELSLKLGDPVSNNEDGKIFSFETRLQYIRNAYYRLKRNISALMRNYSPLFASSLKYVSKELEGEERHGRGIKLTLNGKNLVLHDIKELFVTVLFNGEHKVYNCKKRDTSEYLSTKYMKNDVYEPSLEKETLYYVVLDNKIYILPELSEPNYEKVEVILKEIETNFSELEDDIDISEEYKDLLLEIAANEGMMDLGRQDKFQLYTQDINNQYAALSQYAQFHEVKEGSKVND